jgi:Reverse transcriptase (RNA-dependent DNA polymerase)
MVSNRLTLYLERQQLLISSQYGFRKNHSTYMSLLDIYDKISEACDKNKYSVGIFIDLSKAFDTINHDILLCKLFHYGVRGLALDWFKSYLCNRKQYVVWNGTSSTHRTITCGVPQGSVLGPLLFILYINDIVNCSHILQFILFADDTNLFYSNCDIVQLQRIVNQELEKLAVWFRANRLSLNIRKTNFIMFGLKHLNNSVTIKINDIVIERVYCTKFLGVYIDSKLTWKNHIAHVASKIARGLGAINRAKHILSRKLLSVLYYTMIYPYLSYCNIIWGTASATLLNKLTVLQKRALRIMSNSYYRAHSNPLFVKFGLLKLEDIHILQTALFLFKFKYKVLPVSCMSYISIASDVHVHYTRKVSYFKPVFGRTKVRQNSISVRGPKLWDSLSPDIQNACNIGVFKRLLSTYLLSLYNM